MNAHAVEELRRNLSLVGEWLNARKIEPLLEVLLEPRLPFGLRIVTMNGLAELGDTRLVPALVQLLSDDHRGIRGRAAQTLGSCAFEGMAVREAIPALLRCTEDDDEYVRMKSLIALSEIGEQRAIPAFLELAESSPVTNYRRSAVAALGRLGAPEAEGYFIGYLKDRENAAWAATWLAEIGTKTSVKPLRVAARRDRANRSDYREAIEAIEARESQVGN